MEIITKRISLSKLKTENMTIFTSMLKADVDVAMRIIAVDAELHADLESLLLEDGSYQENIWGINLYPSKTKEEFIEYTALINIRPSQQNFSMEIEDMEVRQKIKDIIEELIDFES